MKHCPECAEPMDQAFYVEGAGDVCFYCKEEIQQDQNYENYLLGESLQEEYDDEDDDPSI